MGVSLLQQYPVKDGLTGAQTIELLIKRVQTLGGQMTGQFLVDCDTLASTLHQVGERCKVNANGLKNYQGDYDLTCPTF